MALTYSDDEVVNTIDGVYLTPEMSKQRAITLSAMGLRSGERVLDVGCGTGLLTSELAAAVGASGEVVGVDVSGEMLEIARRRCNPMPHVALKQGGIERLSEHEGHFDAAACIQVLLYVPGVSEALRQLHGVLKPGGRLVLIETEWRSVLLNTSMQALTSRMFASWDAAVPSPGLPAKLLGMCDDSGFTAMRVDVIPIVATSKTPYTFAGQIIEWTAEHACKCGAASDEEAKLWLQELDELDRTGKFFFSLNRFLFTGVKGQL